MTLTDLILPKRGIALPEVPSYIKLDMAFGLGQGTKLGDKSRYRSHGTISGASWAAGAHGRCLEFDRTVADYVYVAIAKCAQLDFTSQDFSVVIRALVADFTGHPAPLGKTHGVGNGWWCAFREDGAFWVATSNASGVQESKSSPADFVIATWYTVGFSRDGDTITIYKNGVDITLTHATHIDPVPSLAQLHIGQLWDSSQPYDGKIEFLRIFGNVALSAVEHLAYHNALA